MSDVGHAVLKRFVSAMKALTKTRAAEQLAITLLTAGGVVALFSMKNYVCSPIHAIILSLLFVTLVWLVTRRVWAIFAILGAGLASFGIVRLIMIHPVAYTVITEWYKQAETFSIENNLVYIALACLAISALLFWIVRKLQLLPYVLSLLGLVCVAVTVYVHLLVLANRTWVLILLAGGFLILLPGKHYRRIKEATGGENTVTLTALQFTALPIVLVSIVMALLIVPQDASKWQSRTLLNIVYDFNDLIGYWFGEPAPSRSFELAGVGYQPLSDRLGGPIAPKNTRILEVITEKPILLRGAVQDTYSGKGWYDQGALGRFRYDSVMFRSTRNRVFESELPVLQNRKLKDLTDGMLQTVEIEVKYQNSKNTGIFTAGMLQDLDSGKRIEPYFNLQGELFADYAIQTLSYYSFTGEVLNRASPGFDEKMVTLEEAASQYNDSNWQAVSEQYLALPETLPDTVYQTAQTITQDAQTPYQKACAIEKWLAENCTYTYTPDIPPINEDFVAHFLDTKEGYCVYYASAFAVLARSVGLPSRYVTGFALERTTASKIYIATERTAHAWAEVYLYGIGWVQFDPLGFSGGLEPIQAERQSQSSSGQAPQTITPPVGSIPTAGGIILDDTPVPTDTQIWLWILLPLAIAGLVWWLIRRLLTLPMRFYRHDRVLYRSGDTGTALIEYYTDLLRQMDYFELSPYIGETLQEFAPRADRRLVYQKARFSEVTKVYMDYLYGQKQPDRSAVVLAADLHESIEERLVQHLGKTMYLARRALPVLAHHLARKKKK